MLTAQSYSVSAQVTPVLHQYPASTDCHKHPRKHIAIAHKVVPLMGRPKSFYQSQCKLQPTLEQVSVLQSWRWRGVGELLGPGKGWGHILSPFLS